MIWSTFTSGEDRRSDCSLHFDLNTTI